jgi:hypothetical protein
MRKFRFVMEMAGWDPQKVGKVMSGYEVTEGMMESVFNATLAKSAA